MAIDSDRGALTEGAVGSSADARPAVPPAFRALLRGGGARFFVGAGMSLYGDWLTTVGLVVVLYQLSGSAAGPALYMLVRVAPRVAGPWLGGGLADRRSPRLVIVAASLGQAVLAATLIPLHRAHTLWPIYGAVAISQFVGSAGRPSFSAAIPLLVPRPLFAKANALYALIMNSSLFVAPALGALLLPAFGADWLFAIDALSFVVCALLVGTVTAASGSHVVGRARTSTPRRVVRSALGVPAIRLVAVANFATGLVLTVLQAVLVVAAHQRFGGDAAVGYLYASVGLGGLVGGAIALGWIPSRSWTRVAIFLVATIQVVAIAGFSASSSIVEALALLTLSAVTSSSFDTWGITEIQRSAPPGFMGRYNSIIFSSMYSGMLVGAVWALAAARVVAWDVSVQLACVVALVLLALVWVARPPQRPADAGATAREP